ncbi:MAG TPA: sigma-70 family RNA polymerase sigma factor [Tepidisphaeraceae bacterium]|nr:sigma-70 family RNA polymerase sigma factor [Tepidisphaeraceae bacterium]
MEQPDLELAKLAASGDRGAFHMIVERHSRGLFRIARSLCKCNSDAEDVVQDTFLAAYRGIGKFDGRSSLKTWLARIVMKRSISAWRKDKRHRAAVSLEASHDAPGDDGRATRTAGTAVVDQRLDLAAVLPDLADEYREIFVLREIQGLSYAEIAAALHIPAGTVDSRLHRARGELRKRLKGYGPS